MADVIQIARGARPWRPTEDAEVVREYHYYEVPLIGVVRQHGVQFLFLCLKGEGEAVSFWGYCLIRQDEIDELDAIESDEDFERVLMGRDLFFPMVIALAIEETGIVASEVVEVDTEVVQAYHRLSAQLAELAERAQDLATAAT